MIKLSDYIYKFLQDKNVSELFMLPGGGAMHLVDSLGKSGIHYTCFTHEQGAAIAAEAYGQHTNEIGVLLVTSGPGVTNAITGITAGYFDSTPMFCLSGQAKRADLVGDTGLRTRGSQEVQTVDMVEPVTKYAVEINEPESIRYHLERAYYEATTGRKGPVWISVPLDVQATMIDETRLKGFTPSQEQKNDYLQSIDGIVALINSATKPLVLAGNGIKLGNAETEFDEFIRTTNIPVLTTWKTIDLLDENDPLYLGHPGIMGDRGANMILQECDLLLSLGSRLDASLTAYDDDHFAKNAKRVIVDIDPAELAKFNSDFEYVIQGDVKSFLSELLANLSTINKKDTTWIDYGKKVRETYPVVTDFHKNKSQVSAYYFTDILCKYLAPHDVIVPESSGGAGEITYQAFKVKKGQKIKNAAALGSMGFGLPYTIGASLANDRRRTILINGDGAFMLNIQELETIQRLKLPVKIFILNNSGYASIKAMQDNIFDGNHVASSEESGFTLPNISKIAQGYGLETFTVSSNDELEVTVQKVLNTEGAVLCELLCDSSETVSPRVKTIVHEDGTITSGKLEKMWPFLDE